MRVLSYTDILAKKLERQKNISQLEKDVHGHCIHIGDVSYACRKCFSELVGGGIQIGKKCMCNCPMCYYDPHRNDNNHTKDVAAQLGDFYQLLHAGRKPYAFSYQSYGETLIYIDDLEKFGKIFKEIEIKHNIEIYHHLYTNGILANKEMLKRLKDMEVDELRFHVSASNFSKKVFNNMYEAAKMNFIVSVEEPSWPHHYDNLFELLPKFEDLGVKHLNLVEVQITQWNIDNIEKAYYSEPDIGIYKDHYWHLYDNGMVYDIIEEVLAKGYSYSVLDCNSGVERCRHGKMHHVFDSLDFYDRGFAEYQGFNKSLNNKHSELIIN